MRDLVILACEKCKHKNYTTTKNKRTHSGKVKFKKFCPNCRQHTMHKETR